ncbi:MAG TPA: endonuclease/exonuclease/phosphatase family protein [Verrucomicrobiota bacterium]|nr:endonuclease/exonuclease/phosphatase family protein [Verrucomicrobiota bacterium]
MTRFFEPKVSATGLLHATGALAGLCTVAGFFASCSWLLELACHFRLQYALALAAVALLTRFSPRPDRTSASAATPPAHQPRWPSLVYAALALSNLAVLLPSFVPPATRPPPAGSKQWRIVTLNVHTANPRHDLVEAFLRREDPDVILLIEVDARWLTQLEALTNVWPHTIQAPRDDNFGIALFSRHPFSEARMIGLGEAGLPSIEAEVQIGGQPVWIFGTHPLPPSGAENARLRDAQLEHAADHAAARTGSRLLLGDLNTTPWSPVYRRLLARSGLIDTLRGRGYQPTWPGHFVPLWIPLDHCLASPDLTVLDRRVGPHVGSDHRPVIVDLAFPFGDSPLSMSHCPSTVALSLGH